jgi:hypothetical protein
VPEVCIEDPTILYESIWVVSSTTPSLVLSESYTTLWQPYKRAVKRLSVHIGAELCLHNALWLGSDSWSLGCQYLSDSFEHCILASKNASSEETTKRNDGSHWASKSYEWRQLRRRKTLLASHKDANWSGDCSDSLSNRCQKLARREVWVSHLPHAEDC